MQANTCLSRAGVYLRIVLRLDRLSLWRLGMRAWNPPYLTIIRATEKRGYAGT